jgi:hypothetical protein
MDGNLLHDGDSAPVDQSSVTSRKTPLEPVGKSIFSGPTQTDNTFVDKKMNKNAFKGILGLYMGVKCGRTDSDQDGWLSAHV